MHLNTLKKMLPTCSHMPLSALTCLPGTGQNGCSLGAENPRHTACGSHLKKGWSGALSVPVRQKGSKQVVVQIGGVAGWGGGCGWESLKSEDCYAMSKGHERLPNLLVVKPFSRGRSAKSIPE
uniref:Uncharacterized protein n=1 Tax=Sphaerodactylus townsendi TaxID=933632 RepID=A0ACB8ETX1_9SAUR